MSDRTRWTGRKCRSHCFIRRSCWRNWHQATNGTFSHSDPKSAGRGLRRLMDGSWPHCASRNRPLKRTAMSSRTICCFSSQGFRFQECLQSSVPCGCRTRFKGHWLPMTFVGGSDGRNWLSGPPRSTAMDGALCSMHVSWSVARRGTWIKTWYDGTARESYANAPSLDERNFPFLTYASTCLSVFVESTSIERIIVRADCQTSGWRTIWYARFRYSESGEFDRLT